VSCTDDCKDSFSCEAGPSGVCGESPIARNDDEGLVRGEESEDCGAAVRASLGLLAE
jgi:hypothetical protein